MADTRSAGDRVVVAIRGREHAGTVDVVGRVLTSVRLDAPLDDGTRLVWRHPYDVFDVFNDGTAP